MDGNTLSQAEKLALKLRQQIKERMPVIETAHDDYGHGYISPLKKKRYKSSTYYTGMIKDPSLANYKMNTAVNSILEELERRLKAEDWFKSISEIESFISTAKNLPQVAFETAGDFGSEAHAWREVWFKEWINSGKLSLTDAEIDAYPLPPVRYNEKNEVENGEVISACRAIKKFLRETGYIPVFCEIPLVDDVLEVGGMADDGGVFPNPKKIPIVVSDGEAWMEGGFKIKFTPYFGFVDLKTSNQGKKPAYAYQVRGFYLRMFIKTFKMRPKKTWILHTSKEDGDYKLIDLTDMKFLEKDAKNLVHMSRSYDKVLAAFKPKTIIV